MSKHKKQKQQLFYNGMPLSEEDYSALAERFGLTYVTIVDVIDQIETNGGPMYAKYNGVIRGAITELADALTFDPESLEVEVGEVVEESIAITTPIITIPEYEGPPYTKEELEPTEDSYALVDHASTALMQAMTHGNGSFVITDDGICTINPDNPPDLAHSYQVVANVIQLKSLGPKIDDKSAWMLGSIIDSLENLHGENVFSISQVCDQTDKAYNTIVTSLGVFRGFRDKRFNVSFTHHKEAHYAKIPIESKHLVLRKAESYNLGTKQVRSLCSIIKLMDDDQVVRNIRSEQQALDLIATYKANKVMWVVYKDSKWYWGNGAVNEVPDGLVVLDMKNKTSRGKGIDESPMERLYEKKAK